MTIITGDLTTYPHSYLVQVYAKAQQSGDTEAATAAGDEIRRRREELAARKAAERQTATPEKTAKRRVTLQKASDIELRAVKWLWDARIPGGSLSLLAGREELGKSTIATTIAARLTRGTLPGEHEGTPRAVLISATEDSWGHTIRPRLMAAGADTDLVYRLAVDDESELLLTLPDHIDTLRQAVDQAGVVLVIPDPLTSRLGSLDSHKDAEVRQALEPLVSFAETTGAGVLGLIHFNKSAGVDPLTAIMGSRAFVAVPRSVLACVRDGDGYVFGHAKSNLGRRVEAEGYEIDGVKVGQVDGVDVWAPQIRWTGPTDRTVEEIHEAAGDGAAISATGEAAEWLDEYLQANEGSKESRIITDEARREGHSSSALRRARERLGVVVSYVGSQGPNGPQRRSIWSLPMAPVPTDVSQSPS